jgi:hypothetical protein
MSVIKPSEAVRLGEDRGYRRAVDNLTGGIIYNLIREHTYMGGQLDERHAAALAARILYGLTDHLNDLEAGPS